MPDLPEPLEGALAEATAKPFTRRVALATAAYAVLLAIGSLGGNNTGKEILLAQQQASDQWAFYQAKAIREHQYRIQALRLELELLERGRSMGPAVRARFEALHRQLAGEERRYGEEKKGIEREAKRLEHERAVAQAREPSFDFSGILLQIAIVTASVAILAESRWLFGVSLVFAAGGAVLGLNGFLLLFRVPFL